MSMIQPRIEAGEKGKKSCYVEPDIIHEEYVVPLFLSSNLKIIKAFLKTFNFHQNDTNYIK